MMHPSVDKKAKVKNCCKQGRNLKWMYGDSIEWEVYKCKLCKTLVSVPCQIQRFFEDAEVLESQEG